jgi:hypothetical protein
MFNVLAGFSWLSILTAFVPYFLLGALWFTLLFPKSYRISLGRENDTPQKPAPIFIIGPALCCLVITVASAVLMSAFKIDSYGNALIFAVIVGLGYLVANTVNIAINPNIPRPLLYGLISGAYHFVGIVMVCMILATMK